MQSPKLHGGEFWVAYFRGMLVDDEETDAIAFFLMDERKNFVKLYSNETKYAIEMQSGTDPSGFLSGCIICNTDEENGYIISCSGKSKGLDLRLWMDNFMVLKQNIDSFYKTQMAMQMCKEFVMEKIPESLKQHVQTKRICSLKAWNILKQMMSLLYAIMKTKSLSSKS